jgi:hypothetical protein
MPAVHIPLTCKEYPTWKRIDMDEFIESSEGRLDVDPD